MWDLTISTSQENCAMGYGMQLSVPNAMVVSLEKCDGRQTYPKGGTG